MASNKSTIETAKISPQIDWNIISESALKPSVSIIIHIL